VVPWRGGQEAGAMALQQLATRPSCRVWIRSAGGIIPLVKLTKAGTHKAKQAAAEVLQNLHDSMA